MKSTVTVNGASVFSVNSVNVSGGENEYRYLIRDFVLSDRICQAYLPKMFRAIGLICSGGEEGLSLSYMALDYSSMGVWETQVYKPVGVRVP